MSAEIIILPIISVDRVDDAVKMNIEIPRHVRADLVKIASVRNQTVEALAGELVECAVFEMIGDVKT